MSGANGMLAAMPMTTDPLEQSRKADEALRNGLTLIDAADADVVLARGAAERIRVVHLAGIAIVVAEVERLPNTFEDHMAACGVTEPLDEYKKKRDKVYRTGSAHIRFAFRGRPDQLKSPQHLRNLAIRLKQIEIELRFWFLTTCGRDTMVQPLTYADARLVQTRAAEIGKWSSLQTLAVQAARELNVECPVVTTQDEGDGDKGGDEGMETIVLRVPRVDSRILHQEDEFTVVLTPRKEIRQDQNGATMPVQVGPLLRFERQPGGDFVLEYVDQDGGGAYRISKDSGKTHEFISNETDIVLGGRFKK